MFSEKFNVELRDDIEKIYEGILWVENIYNNRIQEFMDKVDKYGDYPQYLKEIEKCNGVLMGIRACKLEMVKNEN